MGETVEVKKTILDLIIKTINHKPINTTNKDNTTEARKNRVYTIKFSN